MTVWNLKLTGEIWGKYWAVGTPQFACAHSPGASLCLAASLCPALGNSAAGPFPASAPSECLGGTSQVVCPPGRWSWVTYSPALRKQGEWEPQRCYSLGTATMSRPHFPGLPTRLSCYIPRHSSSQAGEEHTASVPGGDEAGLWQAPTCPYMGPAGTMGRLPALAQPHQDGVAGRRSSEVRQPRFPKLGSSFSGSQDHGLWFPVE